MGAGASPALPARWPHPANVLAVEHLKGRQLGRRSLPYLRISPLLSPQHSGPSSVPVEATQDPSSTARRKTYFPKSSELAQERVLIPPMQCAEHRNQGQKSQPEEPLCGTPRGKTHTEQMTARTARTQSRDVQHIVSKYVAEMTQKIMHHHVSTEPSSFTTADEQNAERTHVTTEPPRERPACHQRLLLDRTQKRRPPSQVTMKRSPSRSQASGHEVLNTVLEGVLQQSVRESTQCCCFNTSMHFAHLRRFPQSARPEHLPLPPAFLASTEPPSRSQPGRTWRWRLSCDRCAHGRACDLAT